MHYRYPNFDLMRLFLAGQVAVAHAWYTVDPNFGWPGFVMAVPSFLAISGFLVLKSYEFSNTWRNFMRKRVLRILPALIVSFVLCLVLQDWLTSWNSVLNWLTGGLYTLPYRANGPLWSLAWEEAAYVTLAVLWGCGAYRRPIWIWALLALSLLVCWALREAPPHYRIITFLAPAFLTGNLMYLYRQYLVKVHPIVPWVFLVAAVQANYMQFLSYFGGSLLAVVEAFAVVWVGIAGLRLQPKVVPDISYGLYIYHMPFIMFLADHGMLSGVQRSILLMFAVTVPFCLVSWFIVEKPILRLKTRSAVQLA
ncbi:Peptidoglycan/LPS O-acetylase OafA/YrhL, contains acyltransferase and SGNH-hydrolase domains [Aureimonas altamirensis DSM 21988]|uniref:Peptidoglycan/LPS O-acetylase OafA/YrhL, contains acyltransferase and SGNH-hydrolase domains n=2 Tax=Aureimonas altamirensis TaxID=370622 RepID=A0ABY1I2N4_9HYPH|nr:acyltransferase [Aureimonas altamirensis]BAT25715.1 putative acyltransferase precursor [Aureimonas altamirensis]SHI45421.1 Peptidoglycan/LPS O-acetylase OafA/YrhL, contains acyltransferase and SGNH-hydrolase domains [Aureimonas altamirensis DSM 21988]